MPPTKKITLGISATVLALGLGFGAAGMAPAATTLSPAPGVSSPADGNADTGSKGKDKGKGVRGGQGDRGRLAADLATKLGVDEATVASALRAFRDANKTTTGGGPKPDRAARDAALVTSLAGALDVEESRIAAALEEIRTADRSRGAAAMKTRLEGTVTDGVLTQAEADAVVKAVEKE